MVVLLPRIHHNATFEKLARGSGSFREVFVHFLTFFKVFGHFWICLDASGCVRIQSDAFRCIEKRSDTFGNLHFFSIFSADLGDSWSFFGLGGLLLLMFYV